MTLVWFCKKLWFSVRFQFYKINCSFSVWFFALCLMCMHDIECFPQLTVLSLFCLFQFHVPLPYVRAELIQLTVSRSDSELEVQRHGIKKHTLTVDPIMLEDELWTRQHEKPSPNRRSRFFENQTAEKEFSVFEFWGQFGLVFRKPIFDIFIRFRTPLCSSHSAKQCYGDLSLMLKGVVQNTNSKQNVSSQ